jgi:hypothetical protein
MRAVPACKALSGQSRRGEGRGGPARHDEPRLTASKVAIRGWPAGGTSDKVAAMRAAAFARLQQLDAITVCGSRSPCTTGFSADRPLKIRETRNMVMQQFCR